MLHRLSAYRPPALDTHHGYTISNEGDSAIIEVFLDPTEDGTNEFFDEVYPTLFEGAATPFEASVVVYPTAISRIGWVRALSSDLRQAWGTPTLTPGYFSEIAIGVAEEGGEEVLQTFVQRVLDAEIVNDRSVTRAYSYLEDLDVDADTVRARVESGADLEGVLANGERWRYFLMRDIQETEEMQNRTVYVNGMRLDEISVEAVKDAAQSIPTFHDVFNTFGDDGTAAVVDSVLEQDM